MIKTKTIHLAFGETSTAILDNFIAVWIDDNKDISVIDIKYDHALISHNDEIIHYYSAMIIYKEVEPVTFDKIMEYIKASEELVKRVRKELGHFQYDSNSDEGESLGGRA